MRAIGNYPGYFECVSLKDCTRDVSSHLGSFKLSGDEVINTEMKLLLARAGLWCHLFLNRLAVSTYRWDAYLKAANVSGVFSVEEEHELLNICPHHRTVYCIRWKTGKSVCIVPAEMAVHKSANAKRSYQVNSNQSGLILEETNIIVPVGSRELFHFYQLNKA